MKSKLRRILPHVTIVLCNMYIVFFLIDRVNTAMQFINNSITKALLLVLCVLSTVNAAFLIQDERRRQAARNARRTPPRAASASPARRPTGPAQTGARTASPRPAAAQSSAARPNQARPR